MAKASAHRILWDRVGFTASSICAVHCICLPLLIIAIPFLAGTWLVNRELEFWFAGASVCLAIGCSIRACQSHKKYWFIGLPLMGGALLLRAHATAPAICCAEDLSWPHFLGTTLGGGLLASSHFFNLKTAKCESPKSPDCCCSATDCS